MGRSLLIVFALGGSVLMGGCSGGSSSEDAAVNADMSKPGDKMPGNLQQGSAAGTPNAPAQVETGP